MVTPARAIKIGSIVIVDNGRNLALATSHTPDVTFTIDGADRHDFLIAVMSAQGMKPFDQNAADALADEVDVLIARKVIDSRSPAADALLSYRDPPRSLRSNRMAELESAFEDLLTSARRRNEINNALRAELEERTDSNVRIRMEKDAAYRERNRLVAALAWIAYGRRIDPTLVDQRSRADLVEWNAGLGEHDPSDTKWDREWMNIVFIDTPQGQLSWHFHDDEMPLFKGLPAYDGSWDGHTTDEKYKRLERLR